MVIKYEDFLFLYRKVCKFLLSILSWVSKYKSLEYIKSESLVVCIKNAVRRADLPEE